MTFVVQDGEGLVGLAGSVASAAADVLQGWGVSQTATLLGAVLAVIGVAATILTTSAQAAREQKANLYATALGAVANYNEGPYRIRRKDGTATHRNAITHTLSDVKSAIDLQQALLQLHARPGVARAFDHYADASKIEAGQQMHDAWKLPPIRSDREVNLGTGCDRTLATTYRSECVTVMQLDLARRWYKPWNTLRYAWTLHRRPEAPVRSTTPDAAPGADPAAQAASIATNPDPGTMDG